MNVSVRRVRGIWSYENRLVLIFALAGGVASLDAQTVFYLMPFASQELHLDNTQIGFIAFAVMIGWAIAGLVTAPLSDRVGRRKPFLVVAFLLFAAFSTFSAMAKSFVTLFASRLLMGFAEGPVIPVQQAIVMVESSPHRRGLNMGIVQNFGSFLIGGLLGSVIMVHIAVAMGWRAAFFVAGAPGLLVAFLIVRAIREPSRPRVEEPKVELGATGSGLRYVLSRRNIQLCAVSAAVTNGWFYIIMTFLPLWLMRQLHLSAGLMSVLVAMVGLAGMISSIVVPGLSDRFGRRAVMAGATLVGMCTPLSVLLLGPKPLLLGLGIFVGCMAIGTLPLSCSTIPIESVRQGDAATASACIIATAQVGGGLIGPVAAGVLADRFGLAAPLWGSLVLVALGAVASACLLETAPGLVAKLRLTGERVGVVGIPSDVLEGEQLGEGRQKGSTC